MMAKAHTTVVLAAVLVLVSNHGAALAWGSDGHQLIAQIAQTQLTPKAQSEVQKLLVWSPVLRCPVFPPGPMNTAIRQRQPGTT